jgi:hypothetical protein
MDQIRKASGDETPPTKNPPQQADELPLGARIGDRKDPRLRIVLC